MTDDFEWPDPVLGAPYAEPSQARRVQSAIVRHWPGTAMGLHPLLVCGGGGLVVLGPGDLCQGCGTVVPMQTVDGFPVESCRSCEAPIVWAVTADGKSMPVNGPIDPAGNVRLTAQSAAVVLAEVLTQDSLFEAGDDSRPRHTSHFATCPHAANWRRR